MRILEAADTRRVEGWLNEYQGPIGTALDKAGRAWSLAGTSGAQFTVPVERRDVMSPVLAALATDGRRLWADAGTAVARTLVHRSGLPVTDFNQVSCFHTLKAVLRPSAHRLGEPVPGRPKASAAAAGSVARSVAVLQAQFPLALRRLALESVRQDVLWRPRQLGGIALDEELLTCETRRVWGAKREGARAVGVDLTGDGQDVTHWLHAHGITITDPDGNPSLSHRYFDGATVAEGNELDWKVFREARSLKKSMEKLLELTRAERHGRVYPEVVVRHAITGRGAVRRPGMQNIAGQLRPLVIASKGRVLVSLDLNRAEVTIAAAMSGDGGLAAALEAGDPYLALATQRHGSDAAFGLRDQYKKALIASLYGQGSRGLARALDISETEARRLRDGLREEWPQLFGWIESNTDAARLGEPGCTITGRPVPVLSPDEAYKRTNHIVQGSGSDLLYRGIERVVGLLRDRLQLGPDVLLMSVHDEVILEVEPRFANAAASLLAEGMTQELPGGLRLTGEASVLGAAWSK